MSFKLELSPAEWSLYSTLSLILGFSIPFPLCVVEQLVQLVHVPEQRVKGRTQLSNSIIILDCFLISSNSPFWRAFQYCRGMIKIKTRSF